MLYSFNGLYPTTLPHRIRMPDGSTRTDPTTFTDELIIAAGYVAVEDPPQITETQVLTWHGFWSVRDKTPEELENERRAKIPNVVTIRQGRQAMLHTPFGDISLLEAIDQTILMIEDSVQRKSAQIDWEYATEIRRDFHLVQKMKNSLGLTEEQLDELFLKASLM